MARKKTPEELRKQAQQLIELAEQAERQQFIAIGRLAQKHHAKNWKDFNVEAFKKQVADVLG